MNQNDFTKLLNEALQPIKDQLEDPRTGLIAINRRLEDPKTGLKRINEKLDALWDQTTSLTVNAENIKEAIKNQAGSLKQTDENLKKINKRLQAVEANAGIVPPPELTVF